MNTGKLIGKVAAITLGAVGVAFTAAAVGTYIGLKKWSKDDDSDCLRVVINNTKGIRISKTDDNTKYEVEFNYDWQSDPDFMDCANCSGCSGCSGENEEECSGDCGACQACAEQEAEEAN